MGDGEQHEGQVWEAAMSAAHHGVGNLIAIIDRNQYSLDGKVDDVIGIEPLAAKWRAFGWNVSEVDGHDVDELLPTLAGLAAGAASGRAPSLVIAHTVKGKGVPFMESELGWHLGYLTPADGSTRSSRSGAAMSVHQLDEGSWHLLMLLDQAPGSSVLADVLGDSRTRATRSWCAPPTWGTQMAWSAFTSDIPTGSTSWGSPSRTW